ncbi:hypothetical protein QVD17_31154 [Tagetes erecta]|uniref:Cystatin domain-containing protein n=1 Tax=Tagetes erecta TaxID=13708 RepID=A0AAD8K4Z8_TARER|nr:hypothetical protein QVD17_31154 [Tagetes erecta]
MSLSYHTLLSILVVFGCVFFSNSLVTGARILDEDWSPISPTDPDFVKVASFAVSKHNEGRLTHLVFDSIVSGETKNDGGQNYKFIIAAKDGDDGGLLKKYKALVIDRPYANMYELEYFEGPI